ncbi:hypothetical protein TSH100_09760 [Azospirillum sp. TSH100]|uniref:hypothetical protein n=1 Tax=Azospirillum sp. TSH100 TaxID=652764 RepID=UPI000D61D3D0|nr:hypothetical protein [Azospirillum sp. TSH100]PWC87558.1 hypothetical protein TSH100_09760 [Azospirillum sp. TSH100]QCG89522.1 hypothetical protein E6C72_17270 [Azospirillum sp. TSH100]
MAEANIDDRSSLERAYDRYAFEQDAAANARSDATTVHGVTILSAADPDGRIELSRSTRHVGEGNPGGDTVFVAAFRSHDSAAEAADPYSGSVEPTGETPGEAADEYRKFIDQLVETAKGVRFKPDIGRGEERLTGFHGG